jgi:hypothetical protein
MTLKCKGVGNPWLPTNEGTLAASIPNKDIDIETLGLVF